MPVRQVLAQSLPVQARRRWAQVPAQELRQQGPAAPLVQAQVSQLREPVAQQEVPPVPLPQVVSYRMARLAVGRSHQSRRSR